MRKLLILFSYGWNLLLNNCRGELSLRFLFLEKEKRRKAMESLWAKRQGGQDWTKEERSSYEKMSGEADKLNSDIKLRSEYIETFQMAKGKEDLTLQSQSARPLYFQSLKQSSMSKHATINLKWTPAGCARCFLNTKTRSIALLLKTDIFLSPKVHSLP